MPKRFCTAGLLALFAIIATAAVLGWRSHRLVGSESTILYRGRSLDAWFYGDRTNFFSQKTREAAQVALRGVGTNAFPFLLSKLNSESGSPALNQFVYKHIPRRMQSNMRCPISGDDIKSVTLHHMEQLRETFSREDIQSFAGCVTKLRNPRLRIRALTFLRQMFETDPEFRQLCRRLLDDPDPGIRLEAAIPLAESAILSDPKEPRLAPMLLAALQSKQAREHWVDLNSYTYQQQPPGSPSSTRTRVYPANHISGQADFLRRRIRTALIRLEPYLTPEQKTLRKTLD